MKIALYIMLEPKYWMIVVYAIGGRVLNFVSISEDYLEARNKAINHIKKLNWKNGFYRKDIGYKVIDK